MDIRELQRKAELIKRRLDPQVIEREKRQERKRAMVKGATIGGLLAGAAALLLSPDTGENNRKRIKEELEKTKDIIEGNLVEGKEKFAQIYDENKEKIESKKNDIKEKLNFIDSIDMDEFDIDVEEDDLDLE